MYVGRYVPASAVYVKRLLSRCQCSLGGSNGCMYLTGSEEPMSN